MPVSAWFKSRLQPRGSRVDARRATPPDPILPAFTEAGRVRKPRPEPASIRTSSPGTERASGSEKLRFCAFRATTPAFAEAGRGHKTIAKRKKPVHEGPAQTMASLQAVAAFRVQALERSRFAVGRLPAAYGDWSARPLACRSEVNGVK